MDNCNTLPQTHLLISAVKNKRAALFLGAGASKNCVDDKGNNAPSGEELGELLSDKFLNGEFKKATFRQIYDFACSSAGTRNVQEFVAEVLRGLKPSASHLKLTKFPWSGLFTTNYDRTVEDAYKDSRDALQAIKVLIEDKDAQDQLLSADDAIYIKLHGCISRYDVVDPPLVASTDQLINFGNKRTGLFDRFLECSKRNHIIFAGYSFDDFNLRTLVDQIIKDGDNRPPHFIIRPNISEFEYNYWIERRFRPITGTFDSLIECLEKNISDNERKLHFVAATVATTQFTKFISTPGASESPDLVRFFQHHSTIVSDQVSTPNLPPSTFYRGDSRDWTFIKSELDVVRSVSATILSEQIVAAGAPVKPRIIVLKSYAGGGRTVAFKRIAWDTAVKHGKLSIYLRNTDQIDLDRISEIFSLTSVPVHVFVDDVASRVDEVDELIKLAQRSHWPLVLFLSERSNEWNVHCEDYLSKYVDHEYEIKDLSKNEIVALIEKLEKHDCLGELKGLTQENRISAFEQSYSRQLLVALYEITRGKQFSEILIDEYENISPEKAKFLYLDICSLHRFGVPVRAGLISRVHDINFEKFEQDFFLPLEKVVNTRWDARVNDYVYEARHKYIAEVVYTSKVISPDEKLDNLLRIMSRLNPSYSYDASVFERIIKFQNLASLALTENGGSAVYEAATRAFPDQPFVFHQWACFVMFKAESLDDLDRADRFLRRALEKAPNNQSFQHTDAELALKRSRLSKSKDERVAWRTRAINLASPLIRHPRTPHGYHTIGKAMLDAVQDVVREYEKSGEAALEAIIAEHIKSAQDIIAKGLAAFPSEPMLLTTQSELYSTLAQSDRALKSLEKAFAYSPRSVLVARRLSAAYLARGNIPKATSVLLECINHNVGNRDLHYDVAKVILAELDDRFIPDRNQVLIHHLSRSFLSGDKKYDPRFWLARSYLLDGNVTGATNLFNQLKEARIPYAQRKNLRGTVKNEKGEIQRYTGTIGEVRDSFGFLRSEELNSSVYFSPDDVPDRLCKHGQRVRFALSFNMFGPVAIDIEAML